ncbi:MAG: hypothetical protein ACI33S_03515 [Bacilli bacterium]
MNKEDILNTLDKYNLDTNSFIIISGAAMVLYGFKEKTSDIDISVSKDYYNKLFDDFNPTLEKTFKDKCDAYMIDDIINFSTNYYSENYTQIGKYKVQTVKELIELKEKLNRDKDKIDLELIKDKS